MTPNQRAAFWMLGSIVAFSAMAVAGKQITAQHDSFEIMTVRSAVGLPLVLALAAATGQLHADQSRAVGRASVAQCYAFHRPKPVVLGADDDPAWRSFLRWSSPRRSG